MKLSIQAGKTSESINIFIADSSSTTGAGLTGLAYNTGSLVAYYSFTGANATATQITLATLATITTAWASGGFKEIDATNMPGWYRLDLPNAVLASSKGRVVSLHLKGATNMAPCPIEIELTGWDNQNANPDVNLKQIIGTTLTETSAGYLAAGLKKLLDVASPVFTLASINQTGDNYAIVNHTDYGNAKLVRSTTPGNTLTVNSDHTADSNLKKIIGTAPTETSAGYLAAAFTKFFDVATPAKTINTNEFDISAVVVPGSWGDLINDMLDTDISGVNSNILALSNKLLYYFQLLTRSDSDVVSHNATELTAINANYGSGVGTFNPTTDSVQALRDNLALASGVTLADGAITDAKFTEPVLGAGTRATGPLGRILQNWRGQQNKEVLDSASGTLKQYADDNSTVLLTQSLTEVGGVQTRGKSS